MNLAVSSLAYITRPYTEFITLAEKMNFSSVELILDGHHLRENFRKLKEMIEGYSLGVSIHAPFSDLNIASLNDIIREDSLQQIKYAMEIAHKLEAELFTFHSGRLSPYSLWYTDKAWEVNLNSIKELYGSAEELGLSLCIENMPEGLETMLSSPGEVEKLIDTLGEVYFTLDIGHACTGGEALEMIKVMGSRIRNVHIHDNTREKDEHLAVGDGKINFRRIISGLKMYKGNLVIEVHKEEDVLRSKENLEKMLKYAAFR